jgi:hypothetical protein
MFSNWVALQILLLYFVFSNWVALQILLLYFVFQPGMWSAKFILFIIIIIIITLIHKSRLFSLSPTVKEYKFVYTDAVREIYKEPNDPKCNFVSLKYNFMHLCCHKQKKC